MRLIDADALLEELKLSSNMHAENSREFSLLHRDIVIVNEQPTVDAVPVEWIEKQIECLREIADFAFEENGGFIEREHYALHAVERLIKDWHERKEE